MKTQESIQREAEALGVKISLNKKAFAALSQYLRDTESISAIIDGNNRLGVITNERFMTVTRRPLAGIDVKDLPLSKIESVEIDSTIMYTELKIYAANQKIDIATNKDKGNKFKADLDAAIASAGDSEEANQPENDIASQIEKLAELRDKGILTEEEFTAKKTELLSKM